MSIRNSEKIPKKPKIHSVTWFVCRLLLFVWGTVLFLFGYTTQFLQALFAIAFTHLWDMFQMWGGKTFIKRVPYYCQTQLNLFICIGCVVGTTMNMFTDFEYSDIILHTFAGYISATFMFEFAPIINGKNRETGPAMQAMFALLGAMTLLIGWEFYEFSMDRIYGMTLQCSSPFGESGLVDTMWDLIDGAIGALASMFINAFRKNKKINN